MPMNVPRIPRTVVADCENLRAFLFQKPNKRQICEYHPAKNLRESFGIACGRNDGLKKGV